MRVKTSHGIRSTGAPFFEARVFEGRRRVEWGVMRRADRTLEMRLNVFDGHEMVERLLFVVTDDGLVALSPEMPTSDDSPGIAYR